MYNNIMVDIDITWLAYLVYSSDFIPLLNAVKVRVFPAGTGYFLLWPIGGGSIRKGIAFGLQLYKRARIPQL